MTATLKHKIRTRRLREIGGSEGRLIWRQLIDTKFACWFSFIRSFIRPFL